MIRPSRLATALAATALAAAPSLTAFSPAMANGWIESRPWQFETSADKANKALLLDMIERKRGGFYDGFSTTVNNYNVTNIGTQVNCANTADATGNEAVNSQLANSPDVDSTSTIDSDATGNDADNSTNGGGSDVGNAQDNSGAVSSDVADSRTSSSVGPINAGTSRQDLSNRQDNSGDQHASVNDSTACDMTGSTVAGDVKSNVSGPLN